VNRGVVQITPRTCPRLQVLPMPALPAAAA
jgi:hypothetical protein